MNSIVIVGSGGIGSYLCANLADLLKEGQLSDSTGVYTVKVFDPDEVEQKNIMYQDFDTDDIFELKVDIMSKKHGFEGYPMKVENFDDIIESDDDIVVCCVDNAETRRNLYAQFADKPNHWIDLRSHGRHIAMYSKSKKNTLEAMNATLPENDSDAADGSCQRQADLDAGIIQFGNRIIASIGSQAILNKIRNEPQSSRFMHEF